MEEAVGVEATETREAAMAHLPGDLKTEWLSLYCLHHMHEAGDVCYADVYQGGTGVVESVQKEDMTYAVRKLDNTKFRSSEGETVYIRVKDDGPRSPSYGRSQKP